MENLLNSKDATTDALSQILEHLIGLREDIRRAFPEPKYNKQLYKKFYLWTAAPGPIDVIIASSKLGRQFSVKLTSASVQEDKPALTCDADDDIYIVNPTASPVFVGFDTPLDNTNGLPLTQNSLQKF